MIQEKTSELSSKLQEGEPIRLTFHYHTRVITKFINSVIMKLLADMDMPYLHGPVENILREMIVNAVKANSKRVYFKKKHMNISNNEDYIAGMEDFKTFIIDQQDAIASDLKSSGYKVEVILKQNDDGIRVMVRNNNPLMPLEEERIKYRIEKARSYSDFSDIYLDIGDEEEGEGYGIPLTVLFLRNAGLGDEFFSIQSNGKITQSAFTIPLNAQNIEIKTKIQQQIINEIDELPSLPEHINDIQKLCKNPDVSIAEIASKISIDPSLSVSVLRLSNSGGFITARTIENLQDAIMVIGLKNLNSILIASSARKILDNQFSDFKDVWKHCNKTAYYGRLIAEITGKSQIADQIYLASLLHDLGKIVLLSVNSQLMDWITSISVERKMRSSTVIEEVSIGISHSTIGRLIAEKWKLPDYITETIAYHHAPLNSSNEFKDIIFTTYLANKLCLIEDGKFDFLFFEDEVLKYFRLSSEEGFKRFHESLKKSFIEQENNLTKI